jgi:hypothetical protein
VGGGGGHVRCTDIEKLTKPTRTGSSATTAPHRAGRRSGDGNGERLHRGGTHVLFLALTGRRANIFFAAKNAKMIKLTIGDTA